MATKLISKVTPTGLISSILVVGSLVAGVFAIDARYLTTAEASDMTLTQQENRVENDLQTVNLEISFLEDKIQARKERAKDIKQLNESLLAVGVTTQSADTELMDGYIIEETGKRLKFLYQRRDLLLSYQQDLLKMRAVKK